MKSEVEKISIQKIIKDYSGIGDFIDAKPFGSGHINDTYLVITTNDKYILQRINHNIFKNIKEQNNNIITALDHFYSKCRYENKCRFKELTLILCDDGNSFHYDENGDYWRLMNYIKNSVSFDVAEESNIALEAAKAYGYFQKGLLDLNPDNFFPVIKDFHNLDMRLKTFIDVVAHNPANRNQFVLEEIKFVKNHKYISSFLKQLLKNNIIPIRVTHNDTKINNVLLDKNSKKGIAVIDLDTIMPGTVLFDFGDMVRTFTSPVEEDEIDLNKVVLRLNIFEALAKGYLSELKNHLTQNEINNLVFGGKVMTFMIGIRFLTDYLEGDIYYKTSRKNHNLDRCRTQ